MSNPERPPAQRFVLAQSWWIASELCRWHSRLHSRLHVFEMHPGGGMYDVFRVAPLPAAWSSKSDVVKLNRAGTVQTDSIGFPPTPWTEVFAADSAHEIVRRLESACGWTNAGGADATTARSLTYRVIAAVLRSRVDDRVHWDARMDLLDSDMVEPDSRYLELFRPAATAALAAAHDRPTLVRAEEHFWALLRGADPVLLLDDRGTAYSRSGGTVDLHAVYRRRHRLQDVLAGIDDHIG